MTIPAHIVAGEAAPGGPASGGSGAPKPRGPWSLSDAALDRLMPLHLIVGAEGALERCGPTAFKMLDPSIPAAAAVFEHFQFSRPRAATRVADLLAGEGDTLRLSPRHAPAIKLRGMAAPLADGAVLLNLSLGISVVEAVRRLELTASDFAATDLAVELLFLAEANTAAHADARRLTQHLRGAKRAAEEQAISDPLTGLRNRRALDRVLDRLLQEGAPFGLLHVDLDHFKPINDTLGHAAGDEVLCAIARRLERQTRGTDTAARVGGDEFVLVLRGLETEVVLADIAARLIADLERPIEYEGQQVRVSASIGITSTANYAEPDAEGMLADADVALYAAKHAGRGCFRLADGEA